MTDLNRQSGPGDVRSAVESGHAVTTQNTHPAGAESAGGRLSYDQRAAAATEAVRQVEAHLSGESTG